MFSVYMSLENNLSNFDGSTCPTCIGKLVSDADKGERVCSNCGIVIEQNFETGSMFSTYPENGDVKEPTSLMMYDMWLPTFIDKKNVDASGKQIQGYHEIEKLRRLNKFTISNDSKARNLNKAIREIRRITEILGMSTSIAERASYIYRKALSKKLIRGRSITGIVAATIYIACKDAGILFPINQIENLVENCNRKNVVHYYKLLLRQMKMSVGVPEPSQNVSKIAVRARLSGKTERRALEILSKVRGEPILSGKKPVSLAAAALYLAALQIGEYTTQLRIAIASELTTITIRKVCLEIDQTLKQRTTQIDSLPNSDPNQTISNSQENNNFIEVTHMMKL
jgi:transcription initiation factor TFIIB